MLPRRGCVYGGGDGCVVAQDCSIESIEVKGCLCRKGKRRAFSFRNISQVRWGLLEAPLLRGEAEEPEKLGEQCQHGAAWVGGLRGQGCV